MKNCVVRTYGKGYLNATTYLSERLSQGWIVKMATPILTSEGKTEYIEYILEKEDA